MNLNESPLSGKHGDISPINGSISNLAEEGKASASSLKSRKVEPVSERLPNFSRVTPAQLAYITFPSEGRYQPVRAVSSTGVPSANSTPGSSRSETSALGLAPEKYVGGGGILILADQEPEEEAEYIEFETVNVVPPPTENVPEPIGNGHAIHAPPSGPHIALDENHPDANTPEPFEVSAFNLCR